MDFITRYLLSLVVSAHEAGSFDGGDDLKRLLKSIGRHALRMVARDGSLSNTYYEVRMLAIAVHALDRALYNRLHGSIPAALNEEAVADGLLTRLEEIASYGMTAEEAQEEADLANDDGAPYVHGSDAIGE